MNTRCKIASGSRLLLMLLALTLCGCMIDNEKSISERCHDNTDCEGGRVCDPDSGECVIPADVDLLVEVSPFDSDSGSGYLTDQHCPLRGRIDRLETRCTLLPYVPVIGTIYDSTLVDAEGVDARIEFDPVADTFPETLRAPVSTTTEEGTSGAAGMFSDHLLPGTYDVAVFPMSPDSDSFPPIYTGTIEVDAEGNGDHNWSYPADMGTATGTLVLSNEDPVPHSHKVWTVDPVSGRRVSTIDTTGTDGTFRLTMSPSVAEGDTGFRYTTVELRITPEESASAAGYPSVVFGAWSLASLGYAEGAHLDLDAALAVFEEHIMLPPLLNLVVYMARVEGVTSAGLSEPLAEAAVMFTAERSATDTEVGASFETYAVTNAAGEICIENSEGELVWGVMLRENDYTVTITPPAGGEFESLVVPLVHVNYTGDGILMGQVFELGEKPPLVGRVTMVASGDPVEGLTAEAHPVRAIDTGEDSYPLPRFGSDQTGFDGQLRLELDRGVYDVLLRGGPGEGVGWMWLYNVVPGNEATPLDIKAYEPMVLTASVVDDEGAAEADALIKVYDLIRSPATDEVEDMRLVWETTTSGSGSFEVLLAPE